MKAKSSDNTELKDKQWSLTKLPLLYKTSENCDNLPEAYKSCAYLSIDSTAINDYFQERGSTEV